MTEPHLDHASAAGAGLLADAERQLALAAHDPRTASQEAQALAASPDLRVRAVALRALGLAHRLLFDHEASSAALDAAIDAARASGDARLEALCLVTQAATNAQLISIDSAVRLIDRALATVDGADRAEALTQRGGLKARAGDHEGARADWYTALPILDRAGDLMWLGNTHNNLGLVDADAGRLTDAQRHLTDARTAYAQHAASLGIDPERSYLVAVATQNLGCVAMARGDLGASVQWFTAAESTFRMLAVPPGRLPADRSEALLLAGLTDDAEELAARTRDDFERWHIDLDAAEAALVHARASLANGHWQAALYAANDASSRFAEQNRPSWQAIADQVAATAEARGNPTLELVDRLEALAVTLARQQQVHAAEEARLAAAEAAARLEDAERSRVLLAGGGAMQLQRIDTRLHYCAIDARVQLLGGDVEAARTATATGFQHLELHRLALATTRSRLSAGRHAGELALVAVETELRVADPRTVLSVVERTRAAPLRLVPPRTENEVVNEMRQLEREIDEGEAAGQEVNEARQRLATVHQDLRMGTTSASPSISAAPTVTRLEAESTNSGTKFVLYVEGFEDLYCLEIESVGTRLASTIPIRVFRDHLAIITQEVDIALDRGDTTLLTMALGALGNAIGVVPSNVGTTVLCVPPELFGIPWGLMPQLADVPFVVTPSFTHWAAGSQNVRALTSLFAAAGPGLTHADAEVDLVASLYPASRLLTADEAAPERVLEELHTADVAHLACHGDFKRDNALFSTLNLTGGRLYMYDLESVTSPPRVVVLAACDSSSVGASGEEVHGLVTALLMSGVASVVAATNPVPDTEETGAVLREFHRRLVSGASPAVALAEARSRQVPGSLSAGTFTCYGWG